MDLIRDVLDAQVLDRRGRKLGRVDGIVLELTPGRPPRVAGLQIGAVVAAARIHRRLARWLTALSRRLGVFSEAVIIDVTHIKQIDTAVRLDLVSADEPRLLHVERWARAQIVDRIKRVG
jgi:sporulation protein YlmC with PRC-barrel domain